MSNEHPYLKTKLNMPTNQCFQSMGVVNEDKSGHIHIIISGQAGFITIISRTRSSHLGYCFSHFNNEVALGFRKYDFSDIKWRGFNTSQSFELYCWLPGPWFLASITFTCITIYHGTTGRGRSWSITRTCILKWHLREVKSKNDPLVTSPFI